MMAQSILVFSLVFSFSFFYTFAIPPLHLKKSRELSASSETTYRLPNNTKPEAYKLFISTDVADGIFDYFGVVKINITILEESNEITLHQYELNIQKVNLTSAQAVEIPIKSLQFDLRRDFIIFKTVNYQFSPGETVNLEINFKGNLRQDTYGFYRSNYDESNSVIPENSDGSYESIENPRVKKWLATTHFEPTFARRAFPCYDEPALKATFDIEIAHSPKYTAISNMPVSNRRISSNSGSQTITQFQRTPLMSTYSVAFVVSDFDYKEKISANGFTHRIYAQPDKIDRVTFPLEKSEQILMALSDYLGVNYSLPKIDQIAIPNYPEFAGAMENWGLVTYDRPYLLHRGNESIVTFISHEFAHQWFGNLVTPKWWNYLWLSEGLATLYEYIGTDLVQPDWQIMSRSLIGKLHSALQFDATNASRPLNRYVENPNDIMNDFDVFAFDKSSSVFRMFMHAFTEKSFRKGLKYYLTENAYKSVTDIELFESLERAVKEDGTLDKEMNVKDIFRSWSDQKGYPLLIVTRNYTDNTIQITQEQYFNEKHHPEANLTSWWIPYNFDTANNIAMNDTEPEGWLAHGTKSIMISPTADKNWTSIDWVLFNRQQTGYYRVLYDERNYQLLLDYLKSGNAKNIHINSRAQLSNDICEFAHEHRLPRDLCGDFEYYLWE